MTEKGGEVYINWCKMCNSEACHVHERLHLHCLERKTARVLYGCQSAAIQKLSR